MTPLSTIVAYLEHLIQLYLYEYLFLYKEGPVSFNVVCAQCGQKSLLKAEKDTEQRADLLYLTNELQITPTLL